MAILRQTTAFGPGVYRGHPFTLERLRSFVEGTNKAIAAGIPIPLLKKHAPINASDKATEQFATDDGQGVGWLTKVDLADDGGLIWEAKNVPDATAAEVQQGTLAFTSPEFRNHYTSEKAGVYEGPIIRHIAFTPKPGNPHQGPITTESGGQISSVALEEIKDVAWQFAEFEREPLADTEETQYSEGITSEPTWERAKKAVDKKKYPGKHYWAVVSSVYQKMGGQYRHKETSQHSEGEPFKKGYLTGRFLGSPAEHSSFKKHVEAHGGVNSDYAGHFHIPNERVKEFNDHPESSKHSYSFHDRHMHLQYEEEANELMATLAALEIPPKETGTVVDQYSEDSWMLPFADFTQYLQEEATEQYAHREPVDKPLSHELGLINQHNVRHLNDHDYHRANEEGKGEHHLHQQRSSILTNLSKKHAKGVYDHEKAKKLWGYYAKSLSDHYGKHYGVKANPATRAHLASNLADYHKEHNFEQYKELEVVDNAEQFAEPLGELSKQEGLRYKVVHRAANAPKAGAGKYRHATHVRVYDTHHPKYRAMGSEGLVKEWPNVDRRFSGPKSAYGQALLEAHTHAAKLNAEHESSQHDEKGGETCYYEFTPQMKSSSELAELIKKHGGRVDSRGFTVPESNAESFDEDVKKQGLGKFFKNETSQSSGAEVVNTGKPGQYAETMGHPYVYNMSKNPSKDSEFRKLVERHEGMWLGGSLSKQKFLLPHGEKREQFHKAAASQGVIHGDHYKHIHDSQYAEKGIPEGYVGGRTKFGHLDKTITGEDDLSHFGKLIQNHGGHLAGVGPTAFRIKKDRVESFHKAATKAGFKHGEHYQLDSQHAENPPKKTDKSAEANEERTGEETIPEAPAQVNPDMPPVAVDRNKLAAVIAGLAQNNIVVPSDFDFADEAALSILLAAINSSLKAKQEAEAEQEPADPDDEPAKDVAMPYQEIGNGYSFCGFNDGKVFVSNGESTKKILTAGVLPKLNRDKALNDGTKHELLSHLSTTQFSEYPDATEKEIEQFSDKGMGTHFVFHGSQVLSGPAADEHKGKFKGLVEKHGGKWLGEHKIVQKGKIPEIEHRFMLPLGPKREAFKDEAYKHNFISGKHYTHSSELSSQHTETKVQIQSGDYIMQFTEEELAGMSPSVKAKLDAEVAAQKAKREEAEKKALQFEEEKKVQVNTAAKTTAITNISRTPLPPAMKAELLAGFNPQKGKEAVIQFSEGKETPTFTAEQVAQLFVKYVPKFLQFEEGDVVTSPPPKGKRQVGYDPSSGQPVYAEDTAGEQYFESQDLGDIPLGHVSPERARELVNSSPVMAAYNRRGNHESTGDSVNRMNNEAKNRRF